MAQGLAMLTKITPHSAGGGTRNGSNSNGDGNRSNNSAGRIGEGGENSSAQGDTSIVTFKEDIAEREVEAAPVGCDKCYYVD